ncbi:MAG: NAD(P)/FAD-dependent oxidoreductase [Pseudomonadota bacterium]
MTKDIAIIGGSAAGFFTAYLLARQGLQVRVFEASDRINPSPRTLIVTDHVRTVLGTLLDGAVVNAINRFELFADGRAAAVSLPRPDLIIERSTLIHNLAERAEAAGARLLCNHRLLELRPNSQRLEFTLSANGHTVDTSSQIVIGADGAYSTVARSAGWGERPKLPLIQAVVDLPKDMSPHTARVWFLPEETPYFYWLIPFSPTRGVLGLIGEDRARGRESLDWFLEKRGFSPIEFQSALIPHYTRWIRNHRKFGIGHVYLVGDAAGHVKMSTVGGIVTGFRGVLGVAEKIIKGGPSRELMKLRGELNRHLLLRKVLHNFTQADYVALLDMLNSSTRKSLASFTRDEVGKLLFRIIIRQPSFILLAMRSFLLGK